MKISTKGRYGLRAVLDIAMNSEDDVISLSSISERQHISVSYLEQLVAKLRKAGIVKSVRGAQGGYALARPADEISVGDVLRALEGTLNPVDCSEVTGGTNECLGKDVCVSKFVWKRIGDSINQAVDTLMLSQLVEEGKALLDRQGNRTENNKPYCH